MPRHVISTAGAASPQAAYSQGALAGGLVFTAGVGPQDPVTGAVNGTTVEEQARTTLQNLASILEAAGATFDDVVKVTAHLQHLKRDFPAFDAVYREFVSPPFPVRTTVGSDLWDILVEVDVVAAIPSGRPDPSDEEARA